VAESILGEQVIGSDKGIVGVVENLHGPDREGREVRGWNALGRGTIRLCELQLAPERQNLEPDVLPSTHGGLRMRNPKGGERFQGFKLFTADTGKVIIHEKS